MPAQIFIPQKIQDESSRTTRLAGPNSGKIWGGGLTFALIEVVLLLPLQVLPPFGWERIEKSHWLDNGRGGLLAGSLAPADDISGLRGSTPIGTGPSEPLNRFRRISPRRLLASLTIRSMAFV